MNTLLNLLTDVSEKLFFCTLFTLSILLAASSSLHSQSWYALGTGTSSTVYATTVYNGELVAAGDFITAGGNTVNRISRWNGTSWASLSTGMNGSIYALTVFNSQLIAAGEFTTAGGVTANRIASWNGSSWSALGLGMNNTVYSLVVFSGQLRAGGAFTSAGGVPTNRISRWDGSSWFPMGLGTNDIIYAMALYGADLAVGGRFTTAGGLPARRIALYNVNGLFTPLGSGMDSGAVNASVVFGGNLIVGGSFTHIASIPVNYIAMWNGNNWLTIGSGMNSVVNAFSIFSTELIAGGRFRDAGGVSANYVAKWNSTSWSALGSGMSGGATSVNSLAVWSNVLIAGGNFVTAGGTTVNNIAGWGTCPDAPVLISPPDGATGVSLTPTLDWTDVFGASTYGVQVSTNPNFTSTVVNITELTNSQYTILSGILNNNTTYFWRANAKNGLCTSSYSLVRFFTTLVIGINVNTESPGEFRLYQNYPDPFNPGTVIKFDLPARPNNTPAKMKLAVFDVTGKEVVTLIDEEYKSGTHEINFDARSFPSGTYFYRLTAAEYSKTNKMIILR